MPPRSAVSMAREGSIDILMKGHLRTDQLLRPVSGQGKRASHRPAALRRRRVRAPRPEGARDWSATTDGGLTVAPTLEQKRQIILAAIEVLHCLGIARPKIAIMSAIEVVSEAMPSTVDAQSPDGDGRGRESSAMPKSTVRWRSTMRCSTGPPRPRASTIRWPVMPTAC